MLPFATLLLDLKLAIICDDEHVWQHGAWAAAAVACAGGSGTPHNLLAKHANETAGGGVWAKSQVR